MPQYRVEYGDNENVRVETVDADEIMREDGPLSPGIRELIAAYTSARNDCPF